MSVVVEFDGGNNKVASVTIQYDGGDYVIKALHITCIVSARKYGENYIKKILLPIKVCG